MFYKKCNLQCSTIYGRTSIPSIEDTMGMTNIKPLISVTMYYTLTSRRVFTIVSSDINTLTLEGTRRH